jgi:hypothetical protein
MTEEEWLTCADADALFAQVNRTRRTSQRVFRLFCAAFWRWHANHCPTMPAMPSANRAALRKHVDQLELWAETGVPPKPLDRSKGFFEPRARVAAQGTVQLARQWVDVVWGGPDVPVIVCALIREVFGNPFRRVKPNPVWLTSDVSALARGIYDERAFDRMPILADALQDAGCTNEEVLNHCRDAKATHVRGCWVVDLVLEKS